MNLGFKLNNILSNIVFKESKKESQINNLRVSITGNVEKKQIKIKLPRYSLYENKTFKIAKSLLAREKIKQRIVDIIKSFVKDGSFDFVEIKTQQIDNR